MIAVALGAALLLGAGWVVAQQAPAQASSAELPDAQAVVSFVKQTVAWYRHSPLEQQLAAEAGEVSLENDNRELMDQAVRMSFEFARAEADLLARRTIVSSQSQQTDQSPDQARYQRLQDLAAASDKQIKQSQADIETLRQKLETATGARRRSLESAIAETQSEIELAETRRDVLRSIVDFAVGTTANNNAAPSLRVQIEELERAVPVSVTRTLSSKEGAKLAEPATAPISAVAVAPPRTQPSGILALISDLRMLSSTATALDERIQATEALAKASRDLRAPLGARVRQMAKRGDELSRAQTDNPAVLAQQKNELDALTAQFKSISGAVLPLSKQSIVLDLYRRNLTTWRDAVKARYSAELRSLVLRLAIMAVVIALAVGFSELWRKAIFRYVQDGRRRHQFLLLQRILLWFAIAMIVAFGFAAELGSLATFAGLLTAGVAVALQNVILSIAGYFFLIGKYGVRIGDRVQISGVTGEVVDIGLVRLHLMELGTGGNDAQPTGRVVAFSNSVVFQPTGGVFKQIPGTNFVWHQIALTLAPESDYRSVEERLVGAVETVFAEYREGMERQRQHMERALSSVSVSSLRPQSRLRLTQTGLEVVIRYPLELEKAAELEDRITRALLDAIEREPKLKLVGSSTPNLLPCEERATASGS